MKYNITKIRLRKIQDGKRNAGQLFIQFLAKNPDNRLDKGEVTVLDEDFAEDYAEYLNESIQDGVDSFGEPKWKESQLKDANKPIPADMLVAPHSQFEQFVFPGGPRVALDIDGNVRHNEAGKPIIRDSITVFTWKVVDNETGELRYIRGWDPVSRGTSLMNRLYGPMSLIADQGPTGVVLPQGVATPLINSGTAPAAQPGPAPATAAPTV